MSFPQYRQKIRDFIAGDSFRIERTVLDLPDAATVSKAWFTVKANAEALDAAAVLLLTISTTLTSSGQITDAGTTSGTASLRFLLTGTQTLLIVPGTVYVWDIQILLADGGLFTPCKGTIEAEQQVTIATS